MNCIRCRLLQALESGAIPRKLFQSPKFQLHTRRIPQLPKQFSTLPSRKQQQSSNPADDDPSWISSVDREPQIVKVKDGHGPGIILLALIPLTAFALGTWQVKRLQWKTDLIARYEDQLIRPPLPLPPQLDLSALPAFDFRRVYVTGHYRHDLEMLIGPRIRDGEDGYVVVTPFERTEGGSTILVNRGWIKKDRKEQKSRSGEDALPQGVMQVEGLLRDNPKKNMFTPENQPEKGLFFFPDVVQMAELVGAVPVWIESTMEPELFETLRREEKGVPMGRPPAVNLSNNHAQYIFTWYALAAATSIMFAMVFKKAPKGPGGRVRRSSEW
ncbi:SURF1-domain-containing protein [Microthyrium microscopicum]|uniref:SURF1-like protein n=1 Tax=Microthyrium microscopicum TaxID=703497 RepID=A0A6A6UTM2_9PEZI|nr:SURF1-domain-containing protein [Microthyrium microscopicum]